MIELTLPKDIQGTLASRIRIGSIHDCPAWDGPTIHACKDPCHRKAVGYRGTLPQDHPHYLYKLAGDQLYLNMIDPPRPLFHLETFQVALAFLDRHLVTGPVLIHCNRGLSRAPSIALLWMAKRGYIPGHWYQDAVQAFPKHEPSAGIATFLDEHWTEL